LDNLEKFEWKAEVGWAWVLVRPEEGERRGEEESKVEEEEMKCALL